MIDTSQTLFQVDATGHETSRVPIEDRNESKKKKKKNGRKNNSSSSIEKKTERADIILRRDDL